MSEAQEKTRRAMFAAGCFWGVEDLFRHVSGVVSAAVGYSGGTLKNPTYEDVCSGKTGHAEVIELSFDPAVVTYERLLEVFWSLHDPTTRNRQGPDVGTQYRSAVFYHDESQRSAAEAMKRQLDSSGKFSAPIVTEITPASEFYRAEEYHQQYHAKHGGSCPAPWA